MPGSRTWGNPRATGACRGEAGDADQLELRRQQVEHGDGVDWDGRIDAEAEDPVVDVARLDRVLSGDRQPQCLDRVMVAAGGSTVVTTHDGPTVVAPVALNVAQLVTDASSEVDAGTVARAYISKL